MAAIKGKRVDDDNGGVTITWAAVTTADTGAPVSVGDLVDVTVHVVGAGTAQMQGSNDASNFVSIGSALAANSLNTLSTLVKYIQFSTIATNTVTIVLFGRKRKY